MEEFHHYFHQSREIFDNGGNDRITSSDENLIQIFIKDENKSEYFHQIVPISTDSSGFIDRKKIVWIQKRSSFPYCRDISCSVGCRGTLRGKLLCVGETAKNVGIYLYKCI